MYEKIKREVVLWLALAAGIGTAILEAVDAPGWVESLVIAVAAFVARAKVTPTFDPQNDEGRPLVPVD